MSDTHFHDHVFLGAGHEGAERRTWAVIWLCLAMMALEVVGGWMFGSIALIADGLHMSTHAGALGLAALAYTFSRRYARDERFTFGTGKLGDLAGFSSAIVLAMIALLIGYEAVSRLMAPEPIQFAQAIPIAALGLGVNLASAWLLGAHDHSHGHSHGGAHSHDHDESHLISTDAGAMRLEIFETDAPPRFRLHPPHGMALASELVTARTIRPDGRVQDFEFADAGGYLESLETIPEPHAFRLELALGDRSYACTFEEHDHANAHAHRDNNMRAAMVHVIADAAVSVLVIVGLLLARALNWVWMDPLAGLVGAVVIASWSLSLMRDTGAVLLDMTPDRRMAEGMRAALEREGDMVADLHLWRLGPGHLGAIVSVVSAAPRGAEFYRSRLAGFRSVSHLTIEVRNA